jgi:hypothetical protein
MCLVMAKALLPDDEGNSLYAPSSVVIRIYEGGTAYSKLVDPWTIYTENSIRGAISNRRQYAESLKDRASRTAQLDVAASIETVFESVMKSYARDHMRYNTLRQSLHKELHETFHLDQMKDSQHMSFDDFNEAYNRRTHLGDQRQQTAMIVGLSQLFFDTETMKQVQLGFPKDKEEPKETLQRELRQKEWGELRDKYDKEATEAGEVERRVREPTDRFPEHV